MGAPREVVANDKNNVGRSVACPLLEIDMGEFTPRSPYGILAFALIKSKKG